MLACSRRAVGELFHPAAPGRMAGSRRHDLGDDLDLSLERRPMANATVERSPVRNGGDPAATRPPVLAVEPDRPWCSIGPALRRQPLDVRLYLVAADSSRFAAWLRSQAPGTTVGRAGDEQTCPLYRWLVAEGIFDGHAFEVHPWTVLVRRFRWVPAWLGGFGLGRYELVLPGWGKLFINLVDRRANQLVERGEALHDLWRASAEMEAVAAVGGAMRRAVSMAGVLRG